MVNNLILSPSMNYSIYQSSIESATTATSKVQICTLKSSLTSSSDLNRSGALHISEVHISSNTHLTNYTLTSPEAGTSYEVHPALLKQGTSQSIVISQQFHIY